MSAPGRFFAGCDGCAEHSLAFAHASTHARRMHSSERSTRGMRERKRGPAVACVQAYVPPELADELRVRAAREHRPASELVTSALAAFLGAPAAQAAQAGG